MRIVLFVDPEREMREMWKRILDDGGYWVVLADDWSEAARATRREHPDLVVGGPHLGLDPREAETRALVERRGIPGVSCPGAAGNPTGWNTEGEDARGRLMEAIDRALAEREQSMLATKPGAA